MTRIMQLESKRNRILVQLDDVNTKLFDAKNRMYQKIYKNSRFMYILYPHHSEGHYAYFDDVEVPFLVNIEQKAEYEQKGVKFLYFEYGGER